MDDSVVTVAQILKAFRVHLGKLDFKCETKEVELSTSLSNHELSVTNDVVNFFLKVGDFVLLCENAECLNSVSLSKVLQELLSSHISANVVASLLYRIYQSSDIWPSFSAGFFSFLHTIPFASTPSSYFSFPDDAYSNVSLPPTDKWPSQTGWTFHCWIYRKRFTNNNKMHLYCFQTYDRLGFSAYFVNEVLFLSVSRSKGNVDEFPINFSFRLHEWFMLTIVHSFLRWGGSSILCYVNGTLVSNVDVTWHLNTCEVFRTCLIGQSNDTTNGDGFYGHMSNIMGFAEALTPEQISYIYSLGPKYQGQFRFEADICSESSNQTEIISDLNKLYNSLVFAYNPLSCDGRLCLNQTVNFHQSNQTSLHALMSGNVSAVINSSVSDTFIKLGGMQLLYPLFSRLDWPSEKSVAFENKLNVLEILALHPSFVNLQLSSPEIPTILVRFIFGLVRMSSTLRSQFVATKGLLIIANALNQSDMKHLTKSLLDEITNFTLYLLKTIKSTHDELNIHSNSTSNVNIYIILIRQMYGYLLSNSELWCKATLDVQEQLYQFLATDFMEAVSLGYIERIGTIIHCLYALKYYLALTNPRARSGYELCTPDHEIIGSVEKLIKLRTNLLIYLKRLFTRGGITDDEMRLILAFLTTVHEPENIHDVLYLLVSTLVEFPNTCGPVFVRTNGIHCVFKLLTSEDEHVRIYAIKLFGLYLIYGKTSVYGNAIESFALYSLLEERLNSTSSQFTSLMYNALFEVMTECISPKIRINPIIINKTVSIIKNPAVLKVIAHLIAQSEQTNEILSIKDTFIQHLFVFCSQNPYNKKTILQLSVWQDWLLHLVPLYPNNKANANFLVKILHLIRILLIYGICHEYGSWQVLVDTLALIHLHIYEERSACLKEKQETAKPNCTVDEKNSNLTHTDTSVLFSNKSSIGLKNSLGVDLTEYGSCQIKDDQPPSNSSSMGNNSNNNSNADNNKNVDNNANNSCSSSVCNSDQILDRTPSDSILSYENIELPPLSLSKTSPNRQPNSPSNHNHNTENKVITDTISLKKEDKSMKFQLPNFSWSYVHHLLLDDLLCSLENIVVQRDVHRKQSLASHSSSSLSTPPYGLRDNILKQQTKIGKESVQSQSSMQLKSPTLSLASTESSLSSTTVTSVATNPFIKTSHSNDQTYSTDNNLIANDNDDNKIFSQNEANMNVMDPRNESIFTTNILHIISYLSDMIIGACGGLLPLLAAASSSTSEIGSLESLPGMELNDGIGYLLRLTYLADFCILDKNINTKLIESERNLPSGSLARQLLRLYLTAAVRNCLESRLNRLLPPSYIVQTMKQLSSGNDVVGSSSDIEKNLEINEVLFIQSDDSSHAIQSLQIITGSTQTMNDIRVDKINHYHHSNGIDITSKEVRRHHFSFPLSIDSNNPCNIIEDSMENLTSKLLNLSRFQLVTDLEYYKIHRLGFLEQPWKLPDYYTTSSDLFRISDLKHDYDKKISHLSGTFQQLLYSIKPYFNYPKNYGDEAFQDTVINPVKNPEILLQNSDIKRLNHLIAKYTETTKSPDFLALATVYFLSVMMVSKYRDVLDPNPIWLPYANVDHVSSKDDFVQSHTKLTHVNKFKKEPEVHMNANDTRNNETVETKNDNDHNINSKEAVFGITRRDENDTDRNSLVSEDYELVDVPLDNNGNNTTITTKIELNNQKQNALTDLLDTCLGSTGLFLKDLFIEFMDYFSKTLIGTHGQELFPSVLPFLQHTSSVVELVMLLCSQEWQTSLQKYAGWAFIELVNEGRLLSHSIRDHLYRVAVEGDVILNQIHMSNIQQHTKFEEITAHTMANLREEEKLHKNIIDSARLRDAQLSNYLNNKSNRLAQFIMFNWMRSSVSISPTSSSSSFTVSRTVHPLLKDYFRLDTWEDDSRRHRRLIPNPHGTNYSSSAFYNDNMRRRSVCQNHSQQLEDLLKEAGVQHTRDFSINPESVDKNSVQYELPRDNTLMNSTMNESVDSSETINPVTLTWFQEDSLYPGRLCIDFKNTAYLSVPCILVSLGVTVHGTLSISKYELYFEHDTDHPNNRSIDQRVLAYIEHIYSRWSLSEIRAIFNRSFLHRKVALEIFVTSRGSVLFAFTDMNTVKLVVNALPEVGIGTRYGLPVSRASTLASPSKIFQLSNMTQRWQRRELSNFDYLMYLNTIAGRSYNDLNQYPIFPWVISNYTTKELDLSSPSNYRDLSKPIGAINPKRKAFFDERYKNWEDENQPPFHYGTHYSTAAFVLNYLLRIEPFTTVFLNLQGGKFDHPDRIFYSVAKTWENCQINTSDVKELIPEFFYFPEMFENLNDLGLGVTDDGINVDTVILPPWAKSPEEFVRINREALESELVSCQLHNWVDLIFGYKQRGPEAVHATNVFHYLTYDGSVDWDKITDSLLIKAVQDQIQSFGQTPGQLLTKPHPRRNSALHHNPEIFNLLNEEFCMSLKFQSHSPVVHLFSNTSSKALPFPSVFAITENRTIVVCKWNSLAADAVYRKARINPEVYSTDTIMNNQDPQIQHPKTSSNNTNKNNESSVLLTNSSNSSFMSSSSGVTNQSISSHLKENTSTKYGPDQVHGLPLKSETVLPLGRCLGHDFDENLRITSNQFVVTADSRAVILCGYYDRSFRIFGSNNGRLIQAVFGHSDIVTCLARSECHLSQYHYLASGSRDCTVMLWMFSVQRSRIVNSQGLPKPLFILNGHETSINCISLSAELGLVISGSMNGTCLLHSTRGELLRCLPSPCTTILNHQPSTSSSTAIVDNDVTAPMQPNLLTYHREGYLLGLFNLSQLSLYTLNGKLLRTTDLSILSNNTSCPYQINAVLFSNCGRYILIAGNDGVIWILRSYNLLPVHAFPKCDTSIGSLCLSHDQRFIFAGLKSGCLVVFYIDFNQWHHEFQQRYF